MPAIIPVTSLSTGDVLYGDRITSYRWEVLQHSSATGLDTLVGTLDGVAAGSLTFTQNASVKGAGKASVLDLSAADTQAGTLRIAQLSLAAVRLRPVCSIVGLPDNPLGVFLLSNAHEAWESTGRVWNIELLDKCTVPDQESVDQSYAVAAGTLILAAVKALLVSCGETLAIDAGNTIATNAGMVWEAGTTKLKIINDLLDVAGYSALWADGYGNFQATPRVLPANRSVNYELLGIPRELRDGDKAIYSPNWSRDKDSFEVPNKVIAVQAATGTDTTARTGYWINADPTSDYSTVTRGRTITYTLDSVEVPAGTNAEIDAFLQARARATLIQMSSPQATVKVTCLVIPVRVSDVLRFSNTKASIDAKHVITKIQLNASPLGLMTATLQEVLSL